MLYQEFELPKYDWHISVFYNTTFEDTEDIMDCLYEMNCSSEIARKAYDNLSSGQKNTGLTFSKDNATTFTVLSVLFGFLAPIFLFIHRKNAPQNAEAPFFTVTE